ncbi:2Fe-2S iron-sulfur cluster-binding protein [Streptomyces sp. NPDC020801]|uniref:2Fe-2S iron-sulfur cluster-binding protein n=1 Tax=Streptomyces sp. NPDC020801 TaxID=3365093 RepID=UPI00378FF577
MTDDQHGEGAPRSGGRWDPLPQGDYDDGATAFVELPEGGIDALLAADSPLAAPGHGYVPPQITVAPASEAATDPAATGNWTVPGAPAAPAGGAEWPDPNAVPREGDTGADADDRFTYRPGATQQWTFDDTRTGHTGQEDHAGRAGPAGHEGPAGPAGREAPSGPGHDVTGQWSIPVARGDIPDESGEFTTSSLVQQWGGTPPATLPGGAPAPWATEPWGRPEPEGETAGYGPGGHPAPEAAAAPGAPDPRTLDRPEVQLPAEQAEQAEQAERLGRVRQAGQAGQAGRAGREGRAGRGAELSPEAARRVPGAGEAAETDEGPVEAADGPAEPPARPTPAEGAGPVARAAEEASTATESTATEAGSAARHGEHGEHGEYGEHEETAPADDPPAPAPPQDEHPLASYVLRVNGADRPVTDAWIGESLLYVLRERLGLAGAKDGCSQGECGACNVQVDGRLVASCLVPAVTAAGSEVRTVEGLAADGQPSDVQRALARCGAVQCGFCVPGMAMTVHDLLEGNPAPTELEARQALCGNLCRCSGYRGVLEAVREVVSEREAQAAGHHQAETDADEPRIPHQAGPGAGGVHPSAFEAPGSSHPHDPYGQDGGQA